MKIYSYRGIVFSLMFLSIGIYFLFQYFERLDIISKYGHSGLPQESHSSIGKGGAVILALLKTTWWTPTVFIVLGLFTLYTAFKKMTLNHKCLTTACPFINTDRKK